MYINNQLTNVYASSLYWISMSDLFIYLFFSVVVFAILPQWPMPTDDVLFNKKECTHSSNNRIVLKHITSTSLVCTLSHFFLHPYTYTHIHTSSQE